mmetsp:Transcript_35264/g.59438  ORF Transcript_35264/g.59438 Transcript_35264/m.59438 type:complete len:208 (+) Transcript_35264:925-1548(+)
MEEGFSEIRKIRRNPNATRLTHTFAQHDRRSGGSRQEVCGAVLPTGRHRHHRRDPDDRHAGPLAPPGEYSARLAVQVGVQTVQADILARDLLRDAVAHRYGGVDASGVRARHGHHMQGVSSQAWDVLPLWRVRGQADRRSDRLHPAVRQVHHAGPRGTGEGGGAGESGDRTRVCHCGRQRQIPLPWDGDFGVHGSGARRHYPKSAHR